MPQPHVTAAVLRAVRRLPGYPRLRVLDLSAGRGEIAAALARDGCAVRGTHYRADDYQYAGLRSPDKYDGSAPPQNEEFAVDENVDLMRPLTYGGGSFDAVILCEVAEHLPTYIPLIGEIGRVLVPGGSLVLSTPNLARLHSRWHFFWTGTHKLIRRRVGWDLSAGDLYAYHIGPVDFPLLHTLLRQAGLAVERLDVTRFKARHAWLLAAYPLVWLATRLETRRHRGGPAHAEGEEDLFRWMTRPAMLASEQLLLTARKSSPATPSGSTA
ncbi:MAG TPA: methyltransferase domain-containing protein [Thermoanaerobaculia bacterium]